MVPEVVLSPTVRSEKLFHTWREEILKHISTEIISAPKLLRHDPLKCWPTTIQSSKLYIIISFIDACISHLAVHQARI